MDSNCFMLFMLLNDFWRIWSSAIASSTSPFLKVLYPPASPLPTSLLMIALENAELCIPPGTAGAHRSRYLLVRSIIKRHLAIHLPDAHPNLQVNVFPTLKSPEFQDYLRLCPIHFVMAHDGSPKSITSAPRVLPLDADTQPADDD
jgi:hypothetical protein